MEGIGALMSQAVKGEAAEDRFEKLLDERFDPRFRRSYAREIDAHDRQRPAEGFDLEHVRRKLRIHGEVPAKVQQVLTDWLPRIQALAAAEGLRLSDLNHEVHLYSREAYLRNVGPLGPGVKLPASSFRYSATYRIYQIRVVLPDRIGSMESLLTVVRAVLTRLFGDVFLQQEVLNREAYREDVVEPPEALSVGLYEQIVLLTESTHSTPALEAELRSHGQRIRMDYKRLGPKVRSDYFRGLRARLDEKPLPPEQEALVDAVFRSWLAEVQQDLPAARQTLIDEAEALNAQVGFLPWDERPEYLALLAENPLHYLRAAKLRLEFLLETLAAIIEDAASMAEAGVPLSPMAEDRIGSYLEQLRTQNLARPYLVPDVTLSEELQRKKTAFPLEVHDLLQRLPPAENPTRAFKSLTRRLEGNIYQRAYAALLGLRHWVHLSDQGKATAFTGGARHRALMGQVANFKLRRPMLEALFVRMGVVLDLSERAGQRAQGRAVFPVQAFSRAWGHFVAHLLTAEHLAQGRVLKSFDPQRYWQTIDAGLERQLRAGPGWPHAVWMLRHLQGRLGSETLRTLVALLQQPTGTFRFAFYRALEPWAPPEDPDARPAAQEKRLEQLRTWAEAILTARAASLKNAIVLEDGTG